MKLSKLKFLNANLIKIIAAVCMLLDHIGLIWNVPVLRIIGRISMPLFAFFIAEGCRYTKNKVKHFSLIFLLAVVCQVVYAIVEPNEIYLSILITFTISIILIYSLQYFKKCLTSTESKWFEKTLSGLLFCALVALTYFINSIETINGTWFYIDYGFWGCMLPVFASVFDFRNLNLTQKLMWLDNYYLRLLTFTIGLTLLCLFGEFGAVAWYSFIAIVPLLLYNQSRGKLNLKYFFYIFYPIHLAVLYGLALII